MVLDFSEWIVSIGKKVVRFWIVFEIQWKQFEKALKLLEI